MYIMLHGCGTALVPILSRAVLMGKCVGVSMPMNSVVCVGILLYGLIRFG